MIPRGPSAQGRPAPNFFRIPWANLFGLPPARCAQGRPAPNFSIFPGPIFLACLRQDGSPGPQSFWITSLGLPIPFALGGQGPATRARLSPTRLPRPSPTRARGPFSARQLNFQSRGAFAERAQSCGYASGKLQFLPRGAVWLIWLPSVARADTDLRGPGPIHASRE